MKHSEKRLESLLSSYKQSLKQGKVDHSLLKSIHELIYQLLNSGRKHLKKIAISAMFVIGVNQTNAQYFAPPVANQFGMSSSNQLSMPYLVDIDNDGDLDLFNSTYYGAIQYQENTGTATAPNFATSVNAPFGISISTYTYLAYLTFADIDNDGDYDLLTSGDYYSYGGLSYYENTGTAANPAFAAPVNNPFGLTSQGTDVYISFPEFADLDGDGDMDILSGTYDGYYAKQFVYFENTGTASAPGFAAGVNDPFGLAGEFSRFGIPRLVDIDNDGDLDLFSGGEYDYGDTGILHFLENTGTSGSPAFASKIENAFGITDSTYYFAFPALGDLDDDGDLDLIVGEYDGNTYMAQTFYLENLGFNSIKENKSNTAISLYPLPCVNQATVESEDIIKEIRLLDTQGKLLTSFNPDVMKFSFNMGAYPAGVYFVEITGDTEKRTIKMIKQ